MLMAVSSLSPVSTQTWAGSQLVSRGLLHRPYTIRLGHAEDSQLMSHADRVKPET